MNRLRYFWPSSASRVVHDTAIVTFFAWLLFCSGVRAEHRYAGPYTGDNLNRVAFPIGGLGTGMYCLEGTGAISHMSVRHRMEFFHEPAIYAAICLKGKSADENIARVVEGPIPDWKFFGRPYAGRGGERCTYGFPRFRDCEFSMRFPFCTMKLSDEALPIRASITGFSPFTPGDADSSSIPAGALEYTFENTSDKALDAVFSLHSPNFMGQGAVGAISRGFILNGPDGSFAFVVDGEDRVSIDHSWFRGGWWDPQTITWHNVQSGRIVSNPPTGANEPGASLYVPLQLRPGESKTVRLFTCWYVPTSALKFGNQVAQGHAFRERPSRGTVKTAGIQQQPVSGYLGQGLVNTFDPVGDGSLGTLTSPEFNVNMKYLHLLVGGGADGANVHVDLVIDGKAVATATGKETETLRWDTWELSAHQDKQATIRIVDAASGPWGHILVDQITLSDLPLADLLTDGKLTPGDERFVTLADFEGDSYEPWQAAPQEAACCPGGTCGPDGVCEPVPEAYIPWYATKYDDVGDVADTFRRRYDELWQRSKQFSDTLHDTTLPPEVVEAIAANLSILKSPTVLRQHDGRLWSWEGCNDDSGCCAGTCTHVWNYAQAICHLFPDLERGYRRSEFFDSQAASGQQAFRGNLPISLGGGAYDAADGQLGGIMKAHREWRISGDQKWLEQYYPRIKQSMDYMIGKWDPRRTGLLEESHHNTYDINYVGPEGHCGSFYLGALAAMVRMGKAVGDDVTEYESLLKRGAARMEKELFNGEYFIQIVWKQDLINPGDQSEAYRSVAEIVNQQGPKYQYGTGCLSDGVLGFWMARTCGIDTDLVDPLKVTSHLTAVHRHNLKRDLSAHANPQRPTYAMGDEGGLLLCTWPRGNKPLLPFVYSDEVWTGIEYQVASHLMMTGHKQEGLEIVRYCRDRYDGIRRNPLNEYECGHWYARAMSSFALLQGMTGLRYDAVEKTLYVDGNSGDFRAPLFTATGYATVRRTNGMVTIDVKQGEISVSKTVIEQ